MLVSMATAAGVRLASWLVDDMVVEVVCLLFSLLNLIFYFQTYKKEIFFDVVRICQMKNISN